MEKLEAVREALGGDREKLVVDLSCRRVGEGWKVAMDRWQTITNFDINKGNRPSLVNQLCEGD